MPGAGVIETDSRGLPEVDAGGADAVDVSVVLPVYNETGHIEKEIRRIRDSLDASKYSWEIIVIDDGSTDDSPAQIWSHQHWCRPACRCQKCQ